MPALHGKVAIVTGASAGIGRGIALKLAAEGAHVVVSCRTAETGEALAQDIRSSGGSAQCITGDVLSVEQMRVLADRTMESRGKIDILVASAGGLAAATEAKVSASDTRTSPE